MASRVFRRAPNAPSCELLDAQAELESVVAQRPSLADHVALMGDLLQLLFSESAADSFAKIEAARVAEKLRAGVPVLRDEPYEIDDKSFQRRWKHICKAIGARRSDKSAAQLSHAIRDPELSLVELIDLVLSGRIGDVQQRARALGLDVELTMTVVRLALYPVFVLERERLLANATTANWNHGYCAFCGSWPLLAESRGLEQLRFLRCGLCAADWEFPRLACPFCATHDHNRLGYLHAEGEENKYRAATCDECGGYVKVVSTLGPMSASALLVADLATLHLDLIAAERGFAVNNPTPQ